MAETILLYGDIDVNCFFIINNGKCFIVDPGYEKGRVIKYVEDNKLEVEGILLTHAHIDHIGVIDAFKVPVYLHENEYEILVDNHLNGFEYFGKTKPYELSDIELVKINDGTIFDLDGMKIETIFTPGHTVGCVCFKVGNDLYTGDTLFKESVGKWTFPTGKLETLQKTIVTLVDSLEDDIKIHPAHGPSSTIGYEKRNNYYYNEWKKLF